MIVPAKRAVYPAQAGQLRFAVAEMYNDRSFPLYRVPTVSTTVADPWNGITTHIAESI